MQLEGPNTLFQTMPEDYEIGEVAQPRGELTPVHQRNYQVAGQLVISDVLQAGPGVVTFPITADLTRMENFLREQVCPLWMRARMKDCGNQYLQQDSRRWEYLKWARPTSDTTPPLVTKATAAEVRWTVQWGALARIPKVSLTAKRVDIAEVNAINAISFVMDRYCGSACGPFKAPGTIGAAACDRVGAVTANVLFTVDSGANWTAGAVDPFIASMDISDVVWIGNRVIVSRATAGAGGAEIAFSDDYGATWTNVVIGAIVGQTIQDLEVVNGWKLYVGMSLGDIWVSEDRGVSWTFQNTPTAGIVNKLKFHNETLGYAVCAAGVVLTTEDGGTIWTLCAAAGAGNNSGVATPTPWLVWVTNDAGAMYYSTNYGATWTLRANPGWPAAADLNDIQFIHEEFGWVCTMQAGVGEVWYTLDGGRTWEELETPTNAGFNRMFIIDQNKVWMCGEVVGAVTGFIGVAAGAA